MLERQQILGVFRFIKPNMIKHLVNQSQNCLILNIL